MVFNFSKTVQFVSLLLIFIAWPLCAQEITPPTEEPLQLEEQISPAADSATSEATLDAAEQQVETLEQEYAMNGYSVGGLLFNHNYNIYADLLVSTQNTDLSINTTAANLSAKSADFKSVGLAGRYAILPYNKIGTDINISLSTSINHGDIGYSAVNTLRGEINVGYALQVGGAASIYALVGFGYEVTKNKALEEVLLPGGSGFQVGGGAVVAKKFNIELFYSYLRHAVSDIYLTNLAASTASASGTTLVGYTHKSDAISNVILGRVTYNY